MKKYDEDSIICTSENGIIVVFDEEQSTRLSDRMHMTCLAMKELSMNYGFFFTIDGTAGIYGASGAKELLDIYWENNEIEIERSLSKARKSNGIDKFIEVGADILVSCSLAVIETFEEFKQSMGA
jgi:hypothetical protein